jgi:hypothetical protein
MNPILEKGMEYFREIQKLNRFRTFVESLDREDAPENKAAINSLLEGIDGIASKPFMQDEVEKMEMEMLLLHLSIIYLVLQHLKLS